MIPLDISIHGILKRKAAEWYSGTTEAAKKMYPNCLLQQNPQNFDKNAKASWIGNIRGGQRRALIRIGFELRRMI